MRILFLVIASLGLLMALGTVLARNLVYAALYLFAFFFVVACLFILLEAEFLAAMQVLVYIGAVAILILFGIMLTRNIQGDETTGGTPLGKSMAALVSLGILAVLIVGINDDRGGPGRAAWTSRTVRPAATAPGDLNPDVRGNSINDMTRVIGVELVTRFVVPFEIAGLLLTAALVGAIALAQGQDEGSLRIGPMRTTRLTTTRGPDGGNGHAEPGTPSLEPLTTTPASAPR
ncbi:MAG: NADH-quinone oxidoreductase subunit J [Isosphaeraceae bacterium]